MAYSAGGLIQASDYNNFATSLNSILGTGSGGYGYGQTTVSSVSASGTVTATQWSTLVGGVNKVRSHQATFSNLSLYTTGDTINATTDIQTNISTAITNRFKYASNGTVISGSNFVLTVSSPNTTSAVSASAERTVTFSSSDAARYFFNAGGHLIFSVSSVTNTGGTTRGSTLGSLARVGFQSKRFNGPTANAITGSGYTVTTDETSLGGYYDLTPGYVIMCQISGSLYGAAYSGDYVRLDTKYAGSTTNSAKGNVYYFNFTAYSGAQSPAFNDSINLTINHKIDIIPPSETYLTNSWGTPTVA